jgi:hypothetical protein
VPLEPFRVVVAEPPSHVAEAEGAMQATLPLGSPESLSALKSAPRAQSNGAAATHSPDSAAVAAAPVTATPAPVVPESQATAASVAASGTLNVSPSPSAASADLDELGEGFFSGGRREAVDPGRSSFLDDDAVLSDDFSDADLVKRRPPLTHEQELRRARFVRLVAGVIGFGVAVFLVALVVSRLTAAPPDEELAAPVNEPPAEVAEPMAAQAPPPAPANPEPPAVATADLPAPPAPAAEDAEPPARDGARGAPAVAGTPGPAAARPAAARRGSGAAQRSAPAAPPVESPPVGARPPTASFPTE